MSCAKLDIRNRYTFVGIPLRRRSSVVTLPTTQNDEPTTNFTLIISTMIHTIIKQIFGIREFRIYTYDQFPPLVLLSSRIYAYNPLPNPHATAEKAIAYTYDALSQSGRTNRPRLMRTLVNDAPFASTQYLAYYNHRYYSPELGRWLSRDPVEEQGGFNLYAMVLNNAVNWWDRLGQAPCPQCLKPMYDGTHYHVCNGAGGGSADNIPGEAILQTTSSTSEALTPALPGTGITWNDLFSHINISHKPNSCIKNECKTPGETRTIPGVDACSIVCCSKDGKLSEVIGFYKRTRTDICKYNKSGNRWKELTPWVGDVKDCSAKCPNGDTQTAGPIALTGD